MFGKIIFTIRMLIIFATSTFILNTMSYAPYMHMTFKNGFYTSSFFVLIYLLFFVLSILFTAFVYSKFNLFSKVYFRLILSLLWNSAGVFLIDYFMSSASFPLWLKVLMAIQLTLYTADDPNPYRGLRSRIKR